MLPRPEGLFLLLELTLPEIDTGLDSEGEALALGLTLLLLLARNVVTLLLLAEPRPEAERLDCPLLLPEEEAHMLPAEVLLRVPLPEPEALAAAERVPEALTTEHSLEPAEADLRDEGDPQELTEADSWPVAVPVALPAPLPEGGPLGEDSALEEPAELKLPAALADTLGLPEVLPPTAEGEPEPLTEAEAEPPAKEAEALEEAAPEMEAAPDELALQLGGCAVPLAAAEALTAELLLKDALPLELALLLELPPPPISPPALELAEREC